MELSVPEIVGQVNLYDMTEIILSISMYMITIGTIAMMMRKGWDDRVEAICQGSFA